VGDSNASSIAHTADGTPEGREREAWLLLTDAAADAKHPQTRIQALAALGMLRTERAEKMITAAMADPDVDVRTAAVLAAGQTRDPNMTTRLRDLLDDKEPQVAFTAAMTLWKMGDRSGEDILMSIVDGDRSASASMVHGTKHRLNNDLHNPVMLAKLGAMQGAAMLLGPFGYGITAYEYIHQNGGDLARVSAIEQISQERTEPIHRELVAALTDKDQAVRAGALKALVDYHDKETVDAVYPLLIDAKVPVRLTAAAVLLRTSGVPGPAPQKPAVAAFPDPSKRRHLNTPSSTKSVTVTKVP
jgi:HEAT repeat protein